MFQSINLSNIIFKKTKQSIFYLENKSLFENTFDKYHVIIVNNDKIQKTFNTH